MAKNNKSLASEKKQSIENTLSNDFSMKSLFEIGNETLVKKSNSFGATIYKKELFADCKSDKDKKHLRIKLRRKLQAFFDTFVISKNNTKVIEQLKKDWQSYSKIVYQDVNNIVDSNANSDKLKIAKEFLQCMNNTK